MASQAQTLAQANANSVVSRGVNDIGNPYVQFFIRLLFAIAVVSALIVVSQLLAGFIAKRILDVNIQNNEYVVKTSKLIKEVIFLILVFFSMLIWFQILGFDFSLMIGGISMGISLGLKDFLGNMVAGVMILTNKQYRIGDKIFITVPQWTFRWRLETVTTRYSVIKNLDRRKIILPNLSLIKYPVTTYSETWLVRLDIDFTLHYDSEFSDSALIIRDAINEIERVKEKDSTRIILDYRDDNTINCKAYVYFQRWEKMKIFEAVGELKKKILETMKANGMKIPYPQMNFHIKKDDQNIIQALSYIRAQVGSMSKEK